LEGRAFIQGLAIIETDLFVGLSEIEQAGFALDQRKDKVPVLYLITVAKGDVDFA
jgi:hypothetical protein